MNTQADPTEKQDEPPIVRLVVSDPLFPAQVLDGTGQPIQGQFKESLEPVTWILRRPHPFVPDMTIVGLFLNEDGIEIYSTNNKMGMRDLIQAKFVRLVQESMLMPVFEKELYLAELGDDDDDDPPEPGSPESDPEPEAPRANGQA
jgi:hypothetical protein